MNPNSHEGHKPCCSICYEELDEETGLSLVRIDACKHEFCFSCAQTHCTLAIKHRRLPVACPFHASEESCPIFLDDEQVHRFICSSRHAENDNLEEALASCSSPLWKSYRQAKQLRADPKLVACPRCDHLSSTANKTGFHSENSSSPASSTGETVNCSGCGHSFCSTHGDLHPNQTCADFFSSAQGRVTARQNEESERLVRETCKACPHCGAFIELAGGCHHVVCPSCHEDFCFRCGTHQHLTGKGTVRHCHKCNMRYLDHRKLRRQRIQACLLLPVQLPFAILYALVASAVAVLSCGCACCFLFGMLVDEEERFRPGLGLRLAVASIVAPLFAVVEEFGIDAYPTWMKTTLQQQQQQHEKTEKDSPAVSRDTRTLTAANSSDDVDSATWGIL